ncbi:cytochrome c oxidase subunit 3 family protein [Pseudodesulfovibrio sp. zrk46]|uniref:cytochrome c oxidase subunit 3 family protein n=1 Tax=Pseudodesulfovibrio sp. zrk46 TaxID=2725288 RepID=UPI00144A2236|nr:cytochrome c oxidase subunit 3 family protein [Pseudodesulfovibrio sp. zrk46]QJB56724.1 cytochrome c oxidase subunit 3 family protein [Pseudodesulfovibrio sp. zrk46]
MTEHHDYQGAKMGMWIFLFTEILLFGGLFVLFAVTFQRYPTEFHEASKLLDVTMGTTNTVVLITSSLCAALSIVALQRGERKRSEMLIGLTILLACCFLVIKYFEWSAKFHHGIYPGSTEIADWAPGKQAYFALYYAMTGLHGIHVIIGMAVLGWVWWLIRREKCTPDHFVALENAGLYWHLVDLIWIYLFPLYYLIT